MSEDFVSGIVVKINSKPTRGKSDIWSICVETDDGEDWFGFGFDKPDFGEGSEVEFEIEWNGDYPNVDQETFEVIDLVEPRKRSSRGRGNGTSSRGGRNSSSGSKRGGNSRGSSRRGKSGGGKSSGRQGGGGSKKGGKPEVDWERKDTLIRLQSCQNTAIAFVSAAVQHGAITLGKTQSKKLGIFEAAVEEEAERLFLKYDDIADNGYEGNGKGSEEEEEEQYADE